MISVCEQADLKSPVAVQGFLTKPVGRDQLLGALIRVGVPVRIAKVVNE